MKLKIIRKHDEGNNLLLTLSGEMTVYTVARLKEILLGELKSAIEITLNLEDVHEADTSGFQLLVYLKNECRRRGKGFRISALSSRLESIFSLYKEAI
jgi:anti-anti-sigma factor